MLKHFACYFSSPSLISSPQDEQNESPLDTDTSDPVLAKGPIEIDSGALLATVMEATNPPAETAQAAPAQTSAQHETLLTSTTQNPRSVRLRVRVTHINQATHLDNVVSLVFSICAGAI